MPQALNFTVRQSNDLRPTVTAGCDSLGMVIPASMISRKLLSNALGLTKHTVCAGLGILTYL